MMKQIAGSFEKQKDLVKAINSMVKENSQLSKQVERFQKNVLGVMARNLEDKIEIIGDARLVISRIEVDNPSQLRDLAFQIRSRYKKVCLVLGAEVDGKAHLAVMLSDEVQERYSLNASTMIREISSEIQGGGGGQPFFATAGGKNPKGIEAALEKARKIVVESVKI